MTFTDIKRQLQAQRLDNLYIFTGEELEVQRAYINRIAEAKQQLVRRIDSVTEAIKTKGRGLLDNPICFVCRDDADFQKTESAWDSLETLLGDNTLIYVATKIDKRSKFYTNFEKRIVIFDHMTEQVLIKHIKEQVNLSTDNCKELIRVCEADYGRILTEIDKINMLLDADEARPFEIATDSIQSAMTTNEAFEKLLKDGTIYQPPTDAIFSWVDALLSGKSRLAFKLWQECIDLGEPSLRLLLVLYQGVKRLLQVQSCEVKDISTNTGLTTWEINLVKDKVGIYHTGELVEALRNIKAIETGIKTGLIEEEFSVPYAMISLLSV